MSGSIWVHAYILIYIVFLLAFSTQLYIVHSYISIPVYQVSWSFYFLKLTDNFCSKKQRLRQDIKICWVSEFRTENKLKKIYHQVKIFKLNY